MHPKRVFLKGIDYFQLLIDHHSRKKGGPGHEARLAVFLKGKIDETKVRNTFLNHPHCKKLAHARVSKSLGLGFPSLYFTDEPAIIPIDVHTVPHDFIPENFLNIPIDVFKQAPIHVQLFHFSNGNSCVLLTFHHILFDFAGVQSFVYALTGRDPIPLFPSQTQHRSLSKVLNGFMKAVRFTFREANYKMTVPAKALPVQKSLQIEYHELNFSAEETLAIKNKCIEYGIPLNPGLYFLASVCHALHQEVFIKQKNHNFIWVPVPVNTRKKGTEPAILFNGLSFLFYKLPVSALNHKSTLIQNLRKQMADQMRNDMPNAFIDFVNGYWFMPLPFYYPMLNLPSLGKLSSFSFSVLGDTFTQLHEFMGLPVTDVKNYPSNSIAPGYTFLFYEYRGSLKMMSSWVKNQYDSHEQRKVLSEIKNFLIA